MMSSLPMISDACREPPRIPDTFRPWPEPRLKIFPISFRLPLSTNQKAARTMVTQVPPNAASFKNNKRWALFSKITKIVRGIWLDKNLWFIIPVNPRPVVVHETGNWTSNKKPRKNRAIYLPREFHSFKKHGFQILLLSLTIALRTDSKNGLPLIKPPSWLRQTLLLTQRLCVRVYRVLSQNILFFAYFYRDMVNNKRCSWEECERDSTVPEKVVWVTK